MNYKDIEVIKLYISRIEVFINMECIEVSDEKEMDKIYEHLKIENGSFLIVKNLTPIYIRKGYLVPYIVNNKITNAYIYNNDIENNNVSYIFENYETLYDNTGLITHIHRCYLDDNFELIDKL